MKSTIKSTLQKNVSLFFMFALAALDAFATPSGGTGGTGLGGLSTAQTTASNVQLGFYGVVGACAGLYVLYVGVMAFTEKKTWSDFGWSIIHVCAVGGSLSLATWGWGLFGGSTGTA